MNLAPRDPSRRSALGQALSMAVGLAGTAAGGTSVAATASTSDAATPVAAVVAEGHGASNARRRCTCGLIDAHSHYLPPTYAQALADEGLVTLDGGFPVPPWSEEKALAHMDRHDIEASMLSVSSPTVG